MGHPQFMLHVSRAMALMETLQTKAETLHAGPTRHLKILNHAQVHSNFAVTNLILSTLM